MNALQTTLQTEPFQNGSGESSTTRHRGVVLVVDDEEHNRVLLRDSLEARGYEVVEAENGFSALDKISERLPDAVLLDAMMPRMDGFEVCRRVKGNPETSAIPVLMVTALSDRKERLMGIEAGANDFLNKPVDLQDLTLRVANAVRLKQLFNQLRAEKLRGDLLLLNILPKSIAERIKNNEVSIADNHEEATIVVADLVGFTNLAAHISPDQIVRLLNEIFSGFDLLAEMHEMEKIKTVGDAYIAAGGIPHFRPDHAEAAAAFALDILREVQRFNMRQGMSIQVRVGIATGRVVAGVIGISKFAYDLWGEPVNTACHLEARAQPGSIQVSEKTYELLREKFQLSERQVVTFKDGCKVDAYQLLGC